MRVREEKKREREKERVRATLDLLVFIISFSGWTESNKNSSEPPTTAIKKSQRQSQRET